MEHPIGSLKMDEERRYAIEAMRQGAYLNYAYQ
jgi:hypothetical protein